MSSSYKRLIVAVSLILLSGCGLFARFDPQAPLLEKWRFVQKWVPSDYSYLVVADLNRFASTEFYKKIVENPVAKKSIIFGGFDASTDAGLAAFSDGLFYVGGKFDTQATLKKIKDAATTDGVALTELAYKGKTIYTDATANYSFTFLEKYLICQGSPDLIKALIDKYNDKKIIPAEVSTNKVLSGRLTNKMYIYGKMTGLDFEADIARGLKLTARGTLPSKEDATALIDEIAGIRAIKTIQSIDEPWLAEVIDNIRVKQDASNVDLDIEMSPELTIDILKRIAK